MASDSLKTAEEVIADSLPTMAEHYDFTYVHIPSRSQLLSYAQAISKALYDAGYKIVKQ